MASISARRGTDRSVNAWPIWVDALSSLLMVVIFVLMVFVVAQVYLSTTLSGRDQALQSLNRQLAELGELLAMEREANVDLRTNVAQLSAQLQSSIAERERLTSDLATVQAERDELDGRIALLSGRTERQGEELDMVARELEDAFKVIEADREKIELQLREIASLQADIQALRTVRTDLESQVAALSTLVDATRTERDEVAAANTALTEELRLTAEQREQLLAELGTIRDRAQQLDTDLATERERTVLAQREVEERDIRIEELLVAVDATEAALTQEQELTEQGRQEVSFLNQQIAALRSQLQRLEAALEVSEQESSDQEVQIADLGRRLNLALASKVEELSRYRSEFFGRLREALGDRPDIRIVGDRFVFQSEVLFPSASATLQAGGADELDKLADTLLEISKDIPPEVNWILRVDGHTDERPISTAQFPSNWELSTARAIEVVKFLEQRGIPAERLAATGFAANQPLDTGDTEAAYGRNRRIEIKLDQR
ncbi:peptidoglycan -binding protein [Arenibaculum sp.]|uniref:peptidoglycan -binding protein n=1 Tax=Arenibaculum sp. TaxID=2865862 RepID=UPI002E163A35|nr:peptidoglycan -binding protein [Arenibaculum sp.]